MANKCESEFEIRQSGQIQYRSGRGSLQRVDGVLHLQADTRLGDVLCMLSVPEKMICTDLFNFMSPFAGHIEHTRIIQDSTSESYMVLLKFKEHEKTTQFYDMFNEKPFTLNKLEQEVCRLVYVDQSGSYELGITSACSSLEGDEFLPQSEIFPFNKTELPCGVCQQQMDKSVAGILTLLCNHSFHRNCCVDWPYSVCPNCKCDASLDTKCLSCDSKENLGMCMICGHIGCKRYTEEGHALGHFRETNHIFVMELETKSVWDYAGDNYTHRLIQNDPDGKVVECCALPSKVANDEKEQDREIEVLREMNLHLQVRCQMSDKRAEDLYLETQSLKACFGRTQQKLDDSENERKTLLLHFTTWKSLEKELQDEKQINEGLWEDQQILEETVVYQEMLLKEKDDAFQQMVAVVEKSKKSLEECQKYERMFSDSEKERKSLERKNSQCTTKLKSLEKELQDEKQMNECLRNNQQIWQEKVAELERRLKEMEAQRKVEVTELKEQVGDLMRHFEAQAAIEKAPADLQQEIVEGQMFVTQNQPQKSKQKIRKHK